MIVFEEKMYFVFSELRFLSKKDKKKRFSVLCRYSIRSKNEEKMARRGSDIFETTKLTPLYC